jgi:hypothetical protein
MYVHIFPGPLFPTHSHIPASERASPVHPSLPFDNSLFNPPNDAKVDINGLGVEYVAYIKIPGAQSCMV